MSRATRFAWGVLLWNVVVILWGSFVRATSSGAGCGGHWPMCNGEIVPRAPSVATLIEISHRATSGGAFFAVLALLVVTFRTTSKQHPARGAAVAAMVLMLGEVLIGAAIVVLGHVALDPSILHGVFTELHAGNTFLLLAALTLTAHHLGGGARLRPSGQREQLASLAQGFAGFALTAGTGAIAALGDTLFPARSLTEGFAEDLSPGAHLFLHLRTLHPVFALVAFVLLINGCLSLRALGVPSARRRHATMAARYATYVLVALVAQMAIGLVNLWLLVPIPTQLLHLASADVLFVLLVLTAAHALGEPLEGAAAIAPIPLAGEHG